MLYCSSESTSTFGTRVLGGQTPCGNRASSFPFWTVAFESGALGAVAEPFADEFCCARAEADAVLGPGFSVAEGVGGSFRFAGVRFGFERFLFGCVAAGVCGASAGAVDSIRARLVRNSRSFGMGRRGGRKAYVKARAADAGSAAVSTGAAAEKPKTPALAGARCTPDCVKVCAIANFSCLTLQSLPTHTVHSARKQHAQKRPSGRAAVLSCGVAARHEQESRAQVAGSSIR